jgi:signal transduction histidine kinase
MLRNQYKNRIEIIKEYGNVPEFPCYPGKLNQVFMNVLSNAIQAIPDKGEIKITTLLQDKNAVIKIKDSGTGISEQDKLKIFEPFFTTKDVGKGTGLGLSISYGIIKDHNGDVEVNSAPGKGTEFIIKLPINK